EAAPSKKKKNSVREKKCLRKIRSFNAVPVPPWPQADLRQRADEQAREDQEGRGQQNHPQTFRQDQSKLGEPAHARTDGVFKNDEQQEKLPRRRRRDFVGFSIECEKMPFNMIRNRHAAPPAR